MPAHPGDRAALIGSIKLFAECRLRSSLGPVSIGPSCPVHTSRPARRLGVCGAFAMCGGRAASDGARRRELRFQECDGGRCRPLSRGRATNHLRAQPRREPPQGGRSRAVGLRSVVAHATTWRGHRRSRPSAARPSGSMGGLPAGLRATRRASPPAGSRFAWEADTLPAELLPLGRTRLQRGAGGASTGGHSQDGGVAGQACHGHRMSRTPPARASKQAAADRRAAPAAGEGRRPCRRRA